MGTQHGRYHEIYNEGKDLRRQVRRDSEDCLEKQLGRTIVEFDLFRRLRDFKSRIFLSAAADQSSFVIFHPSQTLNSIGALKAG